METVYIKFFEIQNSVKKKILFQLKKFIPNFLKSFQKAVK
jgi:hypothetical protein